MDFDESQKHLQDIIDRFNGDRFQATNYISKTAAKRLQEVDNSISIAEAIKWVINESIPEDLSLRMKQHMNLKTYKTAYMEDLLDNIVDDEITQAVRESFDTSVRIGSLTFFYKNIKEPERKVRVRILTRMCWVNKDKNMAVLERDLYARQR